MKKLILIDFDGTITSEDTNVKLFETYGNSKTDKYKEETKGKDISFMEYMSGLFELLPLEEEKYKKFILEDIELTKGYLEFYKLAKEKEIPIGVVSGGFKNGIEIFFKKHNIDDVKIYANEIDFTEEGMKLSFYHGGIKDCCHIGGCGNCKVKHYQENKDKYDEIIFIGDGYTDKPLAKVAEKVFAKDSLLEYCREEGIDCIPWNDFFDIIDELNW